MRIGRFTMGASLCRLSALSARDFCVVYFGPGVWSLRPRLNILRTRFGPNKVFGIELRFAGWRLSGILHTDREKEIALQAEERAVLARNADDFRSEWRAARADGA